MNDKKPAAPRRDVARAAPEAPMSDDFDEFDAVDPTDTIRTMLAAAIQVGAPVYNSGDARGCYDIYAAVARMLLRVVQGGEDETNALRDALHEAALEPDVNEQAWVMRRAFDRILGEEEEEEEGKDEGFENLN